MYNLYTYEKRKKELESEKINNLIKSKEYIKKRDKLAKKFKSKINNFLCEMAKKPIIIKNNYYLSNNEKVIYSYQKPKFETDRERIEKLINSQKQYQNYQKPINLRKKEKLKNTNIINDYINKNNESSSNVINNNTNNSMELIYHPSDQSNHTPNELEKILDTIYLNQDFENKKEIPDKLDEKNLMKVFKRKMKINDNKKFTSQNLKLKRDLSDFNIKGIHQTKYNLNNLEQKLFFLKKEQKHKKNLKLNLNKTARNFLNDDNNSFKTYFNSIQQAIVCNFGDNNVIKNTKRLRNSASACNFMSPRNTKLNSYGNINDYMKKAKYLFSKKNKNEKNNDISKQNFSNIENRKAIIDKINQLNNPPLYDKPYQKIRKKDLKIIKQMAIEDEQKRLKKFMANKPVENEDNIFNGFFSNYEISNISGINSKIKNIKDKINKRETIEDENLILYNNCVYYKNDQNDMKKLGKIILQKCHFINNKYIDNESNKLQKGTGKLMITNGLSINDFLNKFSLPNLINKNIS